MCLAPAGESTKAYHLLAATMERAGRAGIATFVMRGKEYLAAIFAEGGTLRAVTMRFADGAADAGRRRPCRRAARPSAEQAPRDGARASPSSRQTSSTSTLLEDEYAARCSSSPQRSATPAQDVVEIEEAPPEDEEASADIIDIMAVLKQRMGAARAPARAGPARAPQRAPAPSVRRRRARRQEQEGALRAGQEVGPAGPQLDVARGAHRSAAQSGLTSVRRASAARLRTLPTDRACARGSGRGTSSTPNRGARAASG